jgi:hypothetical protein
MHTTQEKKPLVTFSLLIGKENIHESLLLEKPAEIYESLRSSYEKNSGFHGAVEIDLAPLYNTVLRQEPLRQINHRLDEFLPAFCFDSIRKCLLSEVHYVHAWDFDAIDIVIIPSGISDAWGNINNYGRIYCFGEYIKPFTISAKIFLPEIYNVGIRFYNVIHQLATEYKDEKLQEYCIGHMSFHLGRRILAARTQLEMVGLSDQLVELTLPIKADHLMMKL